MATRARRYRYGSGCTARAGRQLGLKVQGGPIAAKIRKALFGNSYYLSVRLMRILRPSIAFRSDRLLGHQTPWMRLTDSDLGSKQQTRSH